MGDPPAAHIGGSAGQPPLTGSGRRRYTRTVLDLIQEELLVAGQELRPTRRSWTERAVVVSTGELQVGDRLFGTLSGAAKAVTGSSAEAGWAFWAIEGDGRLVTLAELRGRLAGPAAGQVNEGLEDR